MFRLSELMIILYVSIAVSSCDGAVVQEVRPQMFWELRVSEEESGLLKSLIVNGDELITLNCEYVGAMTSPVEVGWYSEEQRLPCKLVQTENGRATAALVLDGFAEGRSGEIFTCRGEGLAEEAWSSYQIYYDFSIPLKNGKIIEKEEKLEPVNNAAKTTILDEQDVEDKKSKLGKVSSISAIKTDIFIWATSNSVVILTLISILAILLLLTILVASAFCIKKNRKKKTFYAQNLARDSNILAEESPSFGKSFKKIGMESRPLPKTPDDYTVEHSYWYPTIKQISSIKMPSKHGKDIYYYEPVNECEDNAYYYPTITEKVRQEILHSATPYLHAKK